MLPTRIRPAGAALLAAACLLLSGTGRSDDAPKAPPPRPVGGGSAPAPEPGEALAVLNQLAQEWAARKGGVQFAHQRFTARAGELNAARQRLSGLKDPAAKAPLVLRAADVDPAIKAAQQRAEFSAARVQHLEAVKAAFVSLSEAATAFNRAAFVAEVQLTKMQEAVRVATGVPADKLPPALAAARSRTR